ncbi:MAG TPA: methylmalonyl Co-A mutase-associated GTPase MeaB, partial [Paracoccaceae bacterium]|nr:methylmalonyl Co-A mutase-associated GTPase MeaB [Paracoccaceae bacterium]
MRLGELRQAGKGGLARALAALETRPETMEALLDEAFAAPLGLALGLTGPPGVGKSSLVAALIPILRRAGCRVAVIAVDPSSKRSKGALLGDRTRMRVDPEDDGVFIRSMAARDRLGGVAEVTYPAMVLMRALYEVVLVETVGVGQSETEIADLADLTVFCAEPGAGDALQFMKAGVVELPDLVLVTKGDAGPAARRTAADLRGALSLGAGGAVPVTIVSALTGDGLEAVTRLIGSFDPQAAAARRRAQALAWVESQIRVE